MGIYRLRLSLHSDIVARDSRFPFAKAWPAGQEKKIYMSLSADWLKHATAGRDGDCYFSWPSALVMNSIQVTRVLLPSEMIDRNFVAIIIIWRSAIKRLAGRSMLIIHANPRFYIDDMQRPIICINCLASHRVPANQGPQPKSQRIVRPIVPVWRSGDGGER